MPIADRARGLGFDVSLISNGSLFNESLLKQLAPQLDWLGISIDSAMPSVNTAIGRVDRHGRLVDPNELAAGLAVARQVNPEVRIKINTVVNRLNHAEDLTSLIQRLAPDKWKALRMLPVVNELLAVTDEQFATFVARHQSCGHIFRAENHQDMRESYLMIDPGGRFFQNSPMGVGQGYVYSQPILEVGIEAAFVEVAFAHERFCLRYAQDAAGEGV
jgi:radical S-adenosyl methionine domain-containing protein 2